MSNASQRAVPRAHKAIKREGALVTIRRPYSATAGSDGVVEPDWEKTTGYAIFTVFTRRRPQLVEGTNTSQSSSKSETQRVALVAARDLDFPPRVGDEIFVGTVAPTRPARIVSVDELTLDGATSVLYTCGLGG